MKEITLFIPCIINYYFPQLGSEMVSVLESLGHQVLISEKQGCCGYPFYQEGEEDQAKEIAQKFLFDFQTGKRDHQTLICSPKCEYMITRHYPQIFNNSVSHNLCQKVLSDLGSYYLHLVQKHIRVDPKVASLLVTDCMSDLELLQQLTGFDQPRTQWHVFQQGLFCCGAGGGVPKNNPERAVAAMQSIFQFAQEQGLEDLYFTDDLCLLFATQMLPKELSHLRCKHIISLIHEQITS